MNFILRYKLGLIGLIVGGIAGYLYYVFVGCNSGTCAITSNPVNSTAYGSIMGALLLDSFRKKKEVENQNTSKNEEHS